MQPHFAYMSISSVSLRPGLSCRACRARTRRRAGGERHDVAAGLRVDGRLDGGQDLVVAGADRLRPRLCAAHIILSHVSCGSRVLDSVVFVSLSRVNLAKAGNREITARGFRA